MGGGVLRSRRAEPAQRMTRFAAESPPQVLPPRSRYDRGTRTRSACGEGPRLCPSPCSDSFYLSIFVCLY